MNRDSYVMYRSFYESLKELKDNERLAVYDAINEYALNHKEVELEGTPKSIFIIIKPLLEASYKKAVNGAKGGRSNKSQSNKELEDKDKQTKSKPKANQKQNLSKTEAKGKQKESKPQAINNVNVNANVNANVKYKYGDHSHVLLSEQELAKLRVLYPNYKEIIQFLDDYIEDKPNYAKEHKSHFRCITAWVADAVEERHLKKKDIQVKYDTSINQHASKEELQALKEFRNEN